MVGREDLTSFVGRERELAEVGARLNAQRLVTLTGPGGIGKTRLAAVVARSVRAVVWVELASIADPGPVAQAVAAALGVGNQARTAPLDAVRAAAAGSDVLLVLDNCEHVVGAAAEVADAVLRAGRGVRVLATSREPLGVPGEVVWCVPPLEVPAEGQSTFEALASTESVRLFVDRAAAASVSFRLTPENAPAVATLCRRLDGLPLAIELAAVRARLLSPAETVGRLDGSLSLLTGGARTGAPRHRTLRATIEWSYGLLDVDETLLFDRLAVFAGGWSLPAAEAVCTDAVLPATRVLELMGRLVDKSLVVAERPRSGETRYRFLETLREFAVERLAERADADEYRARHADHFLALAEATEPELYGDTQGRDADGLERDHDNHRAALRWLVGRGRGSQAARMVVALTWFWYLRNHLGEGRVWVETVLALPDAADNAGARAGLLRSGGTLAWHQKDTAAGRRYFEAALPLDEQIGNPAGVAFALFGIATIAQHTGDFATSTRLGERALALRRQLGDDRGVGFSLHQLGRTALRAGRLDEARARFDEALAVRRRMRHWVGVASSLYNLGNTLLGLGDHDGARRAYAESVALCREMVSLGTLAGAAEGLAALAARAGRHPRALELLGAAEVLRREAGQPQSAVDARWLDELVAPARVALGPAGRHAFARGTELALDAVIALVADEAAGTAEHRPAPAGPLSPREREVATLIARGLSNRELAARLVISERTAEHHVTNILGKLGYSTRAQVAVWASRSLAADDAP